MAVRCTSRSERRLRASARLRVCCRNCLAHSRRRHRRERAACPSREAARPSSRPARRGRPCLPPSAAVPRSACRTSRRCWSSWRRNRRFLHRCLRKRALRRRRTRAARSRSGTGRHAPFRRLPRSADDPYRAGAKSRTHRPQCLGCPFPSRTEKRGPSSRSGCAPGSARTGCPEPLRSPPR